MSTSSLRDFIRINQATVNRLQADLHYANQELKQRGDTSEQSADTSADSAT